MHEPSTSQLLRNEEARLKFLALWLEDRERGAPRSLEDYLLLFPGCAEVIEEELAAPEDATELAAGAVLGRYRVLREIGRGGQGRVYLAEDEELKRKVALKLIDCPSGLSFERRRRFQREAELASRLDHPSLGGVYEARVDGARAYIAMRFVEGESLAAKLEAARHAGQRTCALGQASSDRERWRETAGALEQVARALHRAHSAGVVHRDVKPGNVMIDPAGSPVLVDFGLARGLEEGALSLTRSGELLGTPAYMSPEQVSGDAPVDAQSDVYSLGLVLFECLTLQKPFAAPTAEGLRTQILTQAPPDARSLDPRIPKELATILAFALAKERSQRYATALDLAEDLRRWREGIPLSVRPPSRLARLRLWARRRPAAAALALVLALGVPLILGLLGFLLARWPELREIAAQQRAERIERELEDGYFAFEEGAAATAREHFERARAEDPRALDAALGLSLVELRSRRPEDCLQILFELGSPAPPAAERLRAQALIELGREEEAAAIDARAGAARSDLECFVEGERELFLGEKGDGSAWPRAIAAFGKAIERSPRPRALYLARCAAAANRARDLAAARRCAELLDLHWPTSPTATFFAAFALSELEPHRSLPYFERALAARPGEPRYQFNYANALRAAGRPEEAERAYRRAIERNDKNPGPIVNLANLLSEQKRLDEALALYDRAAEVGSERADVHYNRGCCLQSLERWEEALAAYRQALAIQPQYALAHANVCAALIRLSRPEEALQALHTAIESAPRDGDLYVNLGAVLQILGRDDEAIAATRQATELKPDSIDAWKNLGLLLEGAGADGRDGLPVWREVIRLAPKWAAAHYRGALAERRTGAFAEARASMQRALDLGSTDTSFVGLLMAQIRELDRILELERTLASRLAARDEPLTAEDAVLLAEICATRGLCQSSVEHYERAFAEAPELASMHRLDAACAALDAGLARGEAALRAGSAQRTHWRTTARIWLEEDLAELAEAIDAIDPAVIRRRLGAWKFRLGALGDAPSGEISEAERADWSELWERREALLTRVAR